MPHPARNVELKARDPDPARTLAAALALHGVEDRGVLVQRDTYLRTHRGRLKLREQEGARAHLIAYARADEAEARTSAYVLADVSDPGVTLLALDTALGTEVVVEKDRRLLLWRDVRIHLDRVAGLGNYVELEAVAAETSDLAAEHEKVAVLREALGIAAQHVEATGYAALLLARGAATERLVALAREVRERAHVPYSRFTVGAALRDETGALHGGANVENAAYPEGHCAETSAIGALVARGGTRIEEVAVMADAELITPCGGCRQRLAELGAADVPVHLCGPEGIRRTVALGELLPLGFGAGDLPS